MTTRSTWEVHQGARARTAIYHSSIGEALPRTVQVLVSQIKARRALQKNVSQVRPPRTLKIDPGEVKSQTIFTAHCIKVHIEEKEGYSPYINSPAIVGALF